MTISSKRFAFAAPMLLMAGAAAARPPTIDPTYGVKHPTYSRRREPLLPANWIWTSGVRDKQTIFARRAFDLAAAPRSAILDITADNAFTVFVNGRQVDTSEGGTDANAWQNVHSKDIAPYLVAGRNVIAVRVVNEAGPAGLVAHLDLPRNRSLETDGQWKALDAPTPPAGWEAAAFDDSAWPSATVEAPVDQGVWASAGGLQGWPGYDTEPPYMAHLTLPVVRVLDIRNGSGAVEGAQGLAGNARAVLTVTAPSSETDPASLVLDFGQEVAGRVVLDALTPGTVLVGTGESYEETIKSPWGGPHPLNLAPNRQAATPWSAFRYAKLVFLPSATGQRTIKVRVALDHKYYPVRYRGSFDCSDPLLTKIWYTGAYTAHLCMQEDIWDAPKRDRARWVGDLHVSGDVIDTVFADRFLMEQTLDRLRADAQGGQPAFMLPKSHVNGIPGYSAAYICCLADLHRHIGDYAYLRRHHDDLVSLLEFLRGEFNDKNVFVNTRGEWPFTDWSPGFDNSSPLALATTDLFITKAAREGAFLLREMGDDANADKYDRWASDLTAAAQSSFADPATDTFGNRLQENAMAIYSGVATPEQRDAIYKTVLDPASDAWDRTGEPPYNDGVISPYYGNYIIQAMSMAGHTEATEGLLRSYWGGMIAEGATTFWEAYDPHWPKQDFHANLYADDSHGYFVSLCHGWSAGPTSWLTERVLGIRPTGGGFKTADIAPELGDLAWAEGSVPTPGGLLSERVEKQAGGTVLRIALPKNVAARVFVAGQSVTVNGKAASVRKNEDGRSFILLDKAGKYTVKG